MLRIFSSRALSCARSQLTKFRAFSVQGNDNAEPKLKHPITQALTDGPQDFQYADETDASQQQELRVGRYASARTGPEDLEERRRRLLYQSRKRGWLENDLIFGTFAGERLWSLEGEDLDAYEQLMNEVDPDVFKWCTNQLPTPEKHETPLMAKLKVFVAERRFMYAPHPEYMDAVEKGKIFKQMQEKVSTKQ